MSYGYILHIVCHKGDETKRKGVGRKDLGNECNFSTIGLKKQDTRKRVLSGKEDVKGPFKTRNATTDNTFDD